MTKLTLFSLAAALLTGASAASAQGLTEAQARAVIAPWYSLFNVASRGDVKTIQEQFRRGRPHLNGAFQWLISFDTSQDNTGA